MNPIEDEATPPASSATDEKPIEPRPTNAIDDEKANLMSSPISAPSRPGATSGTAEDDVAAKVLRFLATATPGTLGGVALGLATVTYLVLGSVGLILIGAFGGVVLFINYEARHPEVSRAVRGEKGLDVVERLMLQVSTTKENKDLEADENALLQSFEDFPPETKEALGSLVEAIIRDYVKWWYSPIVPTDRFFPLSCRKTLTSFLLSISNHLSRKRPADAFLEFVTNASSMAIVFFSELSSAFAQVPSDSNMTATDAVYNYLSSNPESNLANLINQKEQTSKFKMVAEDLLGFLERSTYGCDPARIFLREMLAGVILEMTLQTCSQPEWINGWIVYLLEAGEPDLSQAIDVGMQTGPDMNVHAFADLDGNVGNIGLAKPTRSSSDIDRNRRKDSSSHKKKLSKADEEMELAMEEMKRMNQMIVEEEARRSKDLSKVDAVQPKTSAELDTSAVESPLTEGFPGPASPSSLEQSSLRGHSSDGQSTRGDTVLTPITPRSTMDSSSQNSSPKQPLNSSHSQFTSFDQIVPPARDEPESPRKDVMTLHNATITIYDEAPPDKGRIRIKPTWDILIQVEPSSAQHPGWMIVRRYSDFETLHEILRRIATVSGAKAFTEQHSSMPQWKVHTRASLRGELERYLRDACWFPSLAESEGMKRFLEKDQSHMRGDSKSDLSWDSVGKNMLDVLTIAPKGALLGGKAVVGGVTDMLGNIGLGQRKQTSQSLHDLQPSSRQSLSIATSPRANSIPSPKPRDSLDSQRSSVISTQPPRMPPMERRPSCEPEEESLRRSRSDRWERLPSSSAAASASASARASREHSRASSMGPLRSPSATSLSGLKLPPPPDEMPDDYESRARGVGADGAVHGATPQSSLATTGSSGATGAAAAGPQPLAATPGGGAAPATIHRPAARRALQGHHAPLSEQETRVAVELIFAVINELYTLSSAWNIRRTLLAAAKSFLLRPGNPSLTSIQALLQKGVLDAHASDAGLAAQLRKVRENALPTEEERAAWPAALSAEEKERLRVKARRLLIQVGVPEALKGVMGQNATAEAMGRVFDCLQIEEVARGLVFGVMLQVVRVVTH